MRFVPALVLLGVAASATVETCTPRGPSQAPTDYVQVELHAWQQTRKREQYWITRLDPETACVSNDSVGSRDGIRNIVRDCSLEALVAPRLAELIAVYEADPNPRPAGERIGEGREGHGAVFIRADGTRWTSDSKLLREGADLLNRDVAEWLLVGPAPASLPSSPDGWTQLTLRDDQDVLERQLASDGRWSCESWLVSEKTLEHTIIIRRGRLDPGQAAALLDGFAAGLTPASEDAGASPWTASLAGAGVHTTAFVGEELGARWDALAAELDPDCVVDPPPSLAG